MKGIILTEDELRAALVNTLQTVTLPDAKAWDKIKVGTILFVKEAWAGVHPLAIQQGRYSQIGGGGIPGPPPVDYRVVYRIDGPTLKVWSNQGGGWPYWSLTPPPHCYCGGDCRRQSACSDHHLDDGKRLFWYPARECPERVARLFLRIEALDGRIATVSVIHRRNLSPGFADQLAAGTAGYQQLIERVPASQIEPRDVAWVVLNAAKDHERAGVYIASRASIPERAAEWRRLRDVDGHHIVTSWIDEAGPGQTANFAELWLRIEREIAGAERLVLYAEAGDFPLKGAIAEAALAIANRIPVIIVAPGVKVEVPAYGPFGSWAAHPLVSFADSMAAALSTPPAAVRVPS
ncbi:hypothetical protein J2847_005806 [Azospirillum agricola]|uniref:hypothetical protein n=1 Tax=Azospirillum agricola TaxID=1720247 RepID=UPI001AE1275C|nr:hypothetical protein [Azospirillum agricola]MBP2232477.1 hypothetical protein [Azospirillum agricola]